MHELIHRDLKPQISYTIEVKRIDIAYKKFKELTNSWCDMFENEKQALLQICITHKSSSKCGRHQCQFASAGIANVFFGKNETESSISTFLGIETYAIN